MDGDPFLTQEVQITDRNTTAGSRSLQPGAGYSVPHVPYLTPARRGAIIQEHFMDFITALVCIIGVAFGALVFISPFLMSGRISEWERKHEQPTKD